MAYHKAPSRLAEQRAIRNWASEIQTELALLPRENFLEGVVKVFKDCRAKPDMKCAAFWLLDEQPGYYGGDYFNWHSKLRSTRNHPVHAVELFATFKG